MTVSSSRLTCGGGPREEQASRPMAESIHEGYRRCERGVAGQSHYRRIACFPSAISLGVN